MRVSTIWLKEFLNIKSELNIEQMSHGLTMAGLEVEHHLDVATMVKNLKWAKILDVAHENVNVTFGDKTVAVANPSSKFVIGNIVAVDENTYKAFSYNDIGFDNAGQELIMFPDDDTSITVGDALTSLPEFNDHIITLGITPNRADALSHLGIAREVCAFLDVDVRTPLSSLKEMAGPTHEKIVVTNEAAELCPRFTARVIENIKVGESPRWLKIRLLASGIRPINNVVDITNYVMLSRGQPLHAYDFAQVSKDLGRAKIIIRKAQAGEKLHLLDGQKISLCNEDLVIADPKGPLALAGVMGGYPSQVTEATGTILLESAYFAPKNVRLSARRYGLNTQSSFRFERGVDPNGALEALNYAARLLTELANGQVCREAYDGYRLQINPKEVKMRLDRAQSILGLPEKDFDQDFLRARFLKLGIETVTKQSDTIYFRVPTFRPDLEREIDLIEEAARMFGLDKIKATTTVHSEQTQFADQKEEEALNKVSGTLITYGFHEAINYAFLAKEFLHHFRDDESPLHEIELKNPLSERYAVMRTSLLPGLVRNLMHNANNQEKSIRLFEVGTVFTGKNPAGQKPAPELLSGLLKQDSYSLEETRIAGVMAGSSPWYAFDKPARQLDFFDMKGVIESVITEFLSGHSLPYDAFDFVHGADVPYLHPGRSAKAVFNDGQGHQFTLASFGELHPRLKKLIDVPMDVFGFELYLKNLPSALTKKPGFIPFSRFPIIERDLSLLLDEAVQVGRLLHLAHLVDERHKILNRVKVFDVYRGKNIAAGRKSVSLGFSLQNPHRTLTDQEAEAYMNDYLAKAKQEYSAELRN